MVIHLYTNICFGPVLIFFLAYTPINGLPLVETCMGITESKERSCACCICEAGVFVCFAFLLDKPWDCHAKDVWFLHFYLYLIALNSNLQNAFLEQFTCLS